MRGVCKNSIAWLVRGFAIDARSLAVFRMAMAAVLLIDLAERLPDLAAHYTDAGVLPRTARIVMEHNETTAYGSCGWSLHMASGTTWGQAVLFAVAAGFGVCLLIGYRARLAAVVSWLLVVSIYYRNPMLEDAGDTILRTILFWSMFLPLGGMASVDRRLRNSVSFVPRSILSVPGAALLLQICLIYWTTAAEKHSPIWRTEHTALYYTLSLDAFATPLGHRLLAYPNLLSWLTACVYWLEWIGPVIAILPLRRCLARLGVVLAFWSLHLGTALTMELGALPWISMAIWTVFLPGMFWDNLGWRLPDNKSPLEGATAAAERPGRSWSLAGRLVDVALAVLILYVAGWNFNRVISKLEGVLPAGWKIPAYVLGLDQTWRMFAPLPVTEDGWYEIKGTLADGSVVNLWDFDTPLPRRKPVNVAATYRNRRWRKYLLDLRSGWSPFIPEFANWLARRWRQTTQGSPQRQLKHIEIVYHLEKTMSPDRTSTLVTPEILFEADYPGS